MNSKKHHNPSTKEQKKVAVLAFVILISGILYSYFQIGIAPLLIIGIPGIVAYWFWITRYLKCPTHPSVILVPFLVTVAGFEFHVIEEYAGNYPQAISRIFDFAWTAQSFVIVILILTGGLLMVTIGLYYRKPIAGFIAILFIMTRFAEVLLFIFPFIRPQIKPGVASTISEIVSGSLVADMPNYYYPVNGHYYFPGMYTWVLTLVPAIYCIYIINRSSRFLHSSGDIQT